MSLTRSRTTATVCCFALMSLGAVLSKEKPRIVVNDSGVLHAQELIKFGRFTADRRNNWGEHQVSTEEENKFIALHGFAEYAKWYLAIDESHQPDTKAHYKFPYGDFKTVHRCALLAARSRARQYGYNDVEKTAQRLIELQAAKK